MFSYLGILMKVMMILDVEDVLSGGYAAPPPPLFVI